MNDTRCVKQSWTRDKIVLAFELYWTIPRSKIAMNNPQIMELSDIIGNPVGSVKAMLENFKSFDPSYTKDGKVGLPGGSKEAKRVATEYMNNWDGLVQETERIREA